MAKKRKPVADSPIQSPIEAPIPGGEYVLDDMIRSVAEDITNAADEMDNVLADMSGNYSLDRAEIVDAYHDTMDQLDGLSRGDFHQALEIFEDVADAFQKEAEFDLGQAKGLISLAGWIPSEVADGIYRSPGHIVNPIPIPTNRTQSPPISSPIFRPDQQPELIKPLLPELQPPVAPPTPNMACWPIGLPPWEGFGVGNHPICGNRFGIFLDQSLLGTTVWKDWFISGKYYVSCTITTGYSGIRCTKYSPHTLGLPVNPFYLLGGPFDSLEAAKVCYDCGGGGIDVGQPPTPPTPPIPPVTPPTPPTTCPTCNCCPCCCKEEPTSPPTDKPGEEECVDEEFVDIKEEWHKGILRKTRVNVLTGQPVGLPNCPPPETIPEDKIKPVDEFCSTVVGGMNRYITQWQEAIGQASTPSGKTDPIGNMFQEMIGGESGLLSTLSTPSLALAKPIFSLLSGLVSSVLSGAGQEFGTLISCVNPVTHFAIGIRGLMGFAEQWIGIPLDEFKRPLTYVINSLCPNIIPTANEADGAYLANSITYTEWLDLNKANGVCPDYAKKLIHAKEKIPDPGEATLLYNRDLIDKGQYAELLRRNGYLSTQYADFTWQLSQYIPGPSDLVTFMTRDVFDKDTVERFDLDAEFGQKFVGQAKAWAKAQGMTEDQFKYYWRAHWQMPSPQQLFEMLRRNRPGQVPFDQVTTEADVLEALGVNDYAPKWRKRLMAISYNPLTRVDVKRAYELDILTDTDVINAYLDDGYTEKNATTLANFAYKEKVRHKRNLYGELSIKGIAGQLKKGRMTIEEAKKELEKNALDIGEIERIINNAMAERAINTRTKCMERVKKQYLLYEIGQEDAIGKLNGLGYPPKHSASLVAEWTCELKVASKNLTAATLCKYLEAGIISAEEYVIRLVKAGYRKEDALLIVEKCKIDIQVRLLARLQREIEKRMNEEKRKAREAKQARKEAEAELKKREKEALACMSSEERTAYEAAQCARRFP